MLEYKILQAESLINEQQLNELGEKGWRLVAIFPGSLMFFYFIREITQ